MNHEKKKRCGIIKKISPYLIIVLSYVAIIVVGSFLLFLPIATVKGESLTYFDAFFISTSSITITGLSSVSNLASILSPFGKILVLILMQIGGLSIVTLSVFVMYMVGAKIGILNRVLVKETLNQEGLSGMVKLVKRIIIFTFIVEGIGFIINLFVFIPRYSLANALGISVFHAVSAFNNAGFVMFGTTSLEAFSSNYLLIISTAVLIMTGGLGFIVFNDIYEKKSYKKLTIHSKIVIKMNLILLIAGLFLFKISENVSWLDAFFLSVTARTAGFMTTDVGSISALTTLILMILMFIGASPGSTGSGIKTTTAYVLFKGSISFSKGRQLTANQRLINNEIRHKATALVVTAITIILIGTALLLVFENINLGEALFEVVAAYTNVGLSRNLTPSFSYYSKIVIMVLMFIGRVGALTILSLFNKNWYKKEIYNIEYIEESVMIG